MTATPRVRIDASIEGDVHVVRLTGELDLADAQRVRELLIDTGGSRVVVDVSGLTFLDAAGLSGIVGAAHQLIRDGGDLTVRGATGIVRRVFEITDLTSMLQT